MARRNNQVDQEILEDEFLDETQPAAEEWVGEEEFEGQLAVDVYQTKDTIVIKAPIAGVKPEDIDVSIEDNYLRVSGSHQEEKEDEKKHYYSKEIRRGSFERIVSLPAAVKSEGVEADYHNGRLHITMPKAEHTKEHKITINVKK